jgi:vacuolar-type H+-ATPase subunit E/Vma4
MDLNDLKSVKINQLNGIISEKRQNVKTEYDQLMERIKLLQKQMDEYTILQRNIDEIIKIVNMPMKTISLLELISEIILLQIYYR